MNGYWVVEIKKGNLVFAVILVAPYTSTLLCGLIEYNSLQNVDPKS